MRRLLWALSILLLSTTARSTERVSVLGPDTRLAPTDARLHEWCGLGGNFDACTRFTRYRLDTACSFDGKAWRMAVSATFRPVIILRNLRSLTHEHVHIDDVRDGVEALTLLLEGRRYSSESLCRQQALAEQTLFETRLRGFARQSNLARHPQLARLAMKTNGGR
jgi:hypothetical protein